MKIYEMLESTHFDLEKIKNAYWVVFDHDWNPVVSCLSFPRAREEAKKHKNSKIKLAIVKKQ